MDVAVWAALKLQVEAGQPVPSLLVRRANSLPSKQQSNYILADVATVHGACFCRNSPTVMECKSLVTASSSLPVHLLFYRYAFI